MVSAIDYPSTLPYPLQGTLSESIVETWIDDGASIGSTRRRAKFTRPLRIFTFRVIMNATERAALETFYDTTLNYGISSFNWTHPTTSVQYEVQFAGRPQIEHLSASQWSAQFGLEVK